MKVALKFASVRRLAIILFALLLLLGISFSAPFAEEQSKQSEKRAKPKAETKEKTAIPQSLIRRQSRAWIKPILDATTSPTPVYRPVKFNTHEQHILRLQFQCQTCHHDWVNKKFEPKPCTLCHNRQEAKVKLDEAMHETCLGCHIKMKKERADEKTPPSSPIHCMGCHKEK